MPEETIESRKLSQKKVYEIPIRRITSNTNPRNPLSKALQDQGWSVFGDGKSIWALAVSDDAEQRSEYAKLIADHDPDIAALATTILAQGLLQPVEVREGGSGPTATFTLVFGCRRCLAILYNWCVLGKPKEPIVQAAMVKGNANHLLHRAIIENVRKQPSAVEEAKAINWALNNGESKADLCQQYGFSESTLNARLAVLDLPPATQKKIQDGKITVAKAMKAEKESNGNGSTEPPKQPIRKRKEIEEAAQEFPKDSPARMALEWVLGQRDKAG